MNKRLSVLLIALATFSVAFIQSCSEENGDVKYNPDVASLMNSHCITCHGSISPSGGLSLTNYTEVRQSTEFGNLINRMNSTSNPMPPTGILSSNKRQIMDNWVSAGFPEN